MNNHSTVIFKIRRKFGTEKECEHLYDENLHNINIDEKLIYKLENFYGAFSTASRIKILYSLNNSNFCVCELATLLNMTKSAVSHQLKYLKSLGLIKGEKKGKEVVYSLLDDHVKDLIEISIRHVKELEDE